MTTDYQQQATEFLNKFSIRMATRLGSGKHAPWKDSDNEECGLHYLVTMAKGETGVDYKSISFDFWGSIADRRANVSPSEYDVLACISSDVHCPDTFEDFCGEFGYDEDERKAKATFKRCHAFAGKLQAFFTAAEVEALSEIQ